jgi:microcystin-dependent protein
MANNYTDKFEGTPYFIKKGEQLSAAGMTAALNTKEKVENKITSETGLSGVSTDDEYPSAKVVYDELAKTEELVSKALQSIDILPKGTILAMATSSWINADATFQSKWKVCDGTGGTPNLTGRFLRGGTASDALTGGVDSQSVTLTTNHLPAHNHTMKTAGSHKHTYYIATGITDGGGVGWRDNDNPFTTAKDTSTNGEHTHMIDSVGGGQPFTVNTIPSYYTVIYIMKVS